jgi:hypothetical protein
MLRLAALALCATAAAAEGVQCIDGTYYWGSLDNKHYCVKCPAGFTSKGCHDCAVDKLGGTCYKPDSACTRGTFISGASTCTKCPAGKWQPSNGRQSCYACPTGHFQPNAGVYSCYACVKGQYADKTDSAKCTKCTQCAKGQFSSTALTGSNAASQCTCTPCAAGHYTPAGYGHCFACPEGRFQHTKGHYSCYNCPAGKFGGAKGAISCSSCPVGKTTEPGVTSAKVVTACTATAKHPTCAAGRFMHLDAARGQVYCLYCPAGKFGYKDGSYKFGGVCEACAKGRYNPSSHQTECKPCTAGTFTPTLGAMKCEAPKCAAGSRRVQISATEHECIACSEGTYGLFDQCEKCGKYEIQKATGQSSCTKCPEGWFANEKRTGCAKACVVCPQAVPQCDANCAQCEVLPTRCDACAKAVCKVFKTMSPTTAPTPAPTPISCAAGSARNGAAGSSCHACPAGRFTATADQDECTYCARGQFSGRGDTRCCASTAVSEYTRQLSCPKPTHGCTYELSEALETTGPNAGCKKYPCGVLKCTKCAVSPFSEWSKCSQDCDGGLQTRTRTITTDGTDCPHLQEQRPCNAQSCTVQCEVSAWSTWSACSMSCGAKGIKTRTRTTIRAGNIDNNCPPLKESLVCDMSATKCPCVECGSDDAECPRGCAECQINHPTCQSCGVTTCNLWYDETKNPEPVDESVPVIKVIDGSIQTYPQMLNDNYDDPGATCTFKGHDISENVVATGDSVHLSQDGNYKIDYSCKTDSGIAAVKKSRIVMVEPLLPRIELVGGAAVTIEGSDVKTYTDEGSTCFFGKQDISNRITFDASAVNLSLPGTYHVTYACTTKNGRKAPSVVRTVVVKRFARPVLTLNEGLFTKYHVLAKDDWRKLRDPGATCMYGGSSHAPAVRRSGDTIFLNKAGLYHTQYDCEIDGFKAKSITRKVLVTHSTPKITVSGAVSVTILQTADRYYKDSGAKCTDVVDGELKLLPVVGVRKVNLNLPGTYEITYACENLVGIRTTATRTIVVEKHIKTRCPAGQFLDFQRCFGCPAGKFSSGWGTTCTYCGKGSYIDTTGADGCRRCPSGKIPSPFRTECYDSEKPAPTPAPDTVCVRGQYTPENTDKCQTCPKGKYGTIGGPQCDNAFIARSSSLCKVPVCRTCAAGRYQGKTGQEGCLSCVPGKVSSVDFSTCKLPTTCTAGKFQKFPWDSFCYHCPAGTFGTKVANGEVGCKKCDTVDTYQPLKGMITCAKCGPGMVADHTHTRCIKKMTCSGGMVFDACSSPCEPTCDDPNPVCSKACVPKCQCPKEFPVWNGSTCRKAHECGCSHLSCVYRHNRVITRHNSKEAKQGHHECKYNASTKQCACKCKTEGSTFVSAKLHAPWIASIPGIGAYHHPCPYDKPLLGSLDGVCYRNWKTDLWNKDRAPPQWKGNWSCAPGCAKWNDGQGRICDCKMLRISGCKAPVFGAEKVEPHCVTWEETARPRIKLMGGNHIVMSASGARKWQNVEPAFKCLDRYGKVASTKVDVVGIPNLAKVGTYEVKFSCKNAQGVQSDVQTLTVDVRQAPFSPDASCPLQCSTWNDGCNDCFCVGGIIQQCGTDKTLYQAFKLERKTCSNGDIGSEYADKPRGAPGCTKYRPVERPRIALQGSDKMTFIQSETPGENYVDAGATCTSGDGLRKLKVVLTGAPDLHTPGFYQVTYNCEDDRTNSKAGAVMRDVTVTVPPPTSV